MIFAIITLFSTLWGIGNYAMERSFVIVTTSYNNAQYYKKNLESLLSQDYVNYRIVYIDDCSSDGTGSSVKEYVAKNNANNVPFTFIKNRGRVGALQNIYFVVHLCGKNEIVVSVDGDDWLAHDKVLSYLNAVYQNSNVWMTYGSYQRVSNGQVGGNRPYGCEAVLKNAYRSSRFRATHLRTFYAGLFQKIAVEDLLYGGEFFEMGWDLAFMLPMLEMACDKIKHVDQVLYMYNDKNALSDSRNPHKQVKLATAAVRKKKYNQISEF